MKILRKLVHNENTESFSVELGESNKLFSFNADGIISLNTSIDYYGYIFNYIVSIKQGEILEYYLCSGEVKNDKVIAKAYNKKEKSISDRFFPYT